MAETLRIIDASGAVTVTPLKAGQDALEAAAELVDDSLFTGHAPALVEYRAASGAVLWRKNPADVLAATWSESQCSLRRELEYLETAQRAARGEAV